MWLRDWAWVVQISSVSWVMVITGFFFEACNKMAGLMDGLTIGSGGGWGAGVAWDWGGGMVGGACAVAFTGSDTSASTVVAVASSAASMVLAATFLFLWRV